MKIHRVRSGESVYSIAKDYAVLPSRIIEVNGLDNPDRLLVGEELLILMPTRTHTVREGESLKNISFRFCVKESDILAKNPSLRGEKALHAGQILTLKSDTPPYGMAFANGYCYRDTAIERLVAVLPYLTYVTVAAARVVRDDVKLLFDDSRHIKMIRDMGKSPLLRLYCEAGDGRLEKPIVDTAILLAKARGYDGITLSINGVTDNKALSEFVHELKVTLIDYGLLLFVEIDQNRNVRIDDYYDGAILSYSKAYLDTPPSFKDGEERLLSEFADEYESSKAYIDLSPFAYSNGGFLPINDAMKIARDNGYEIVHDDNCGLCRFEYGRFQKKEPRTFCFESLENIKAKLNLIYELGYMGVSVDVTHTPISHLMMFEAMFKEGAYVSRLY